MTTTSVERILASSNLVLFFSLPFRPVGKKNVFYNGHIALCLNDLVYQVYNPQLLKSRFLFSVMPVAKWLFGRGGKWVERDPASPQFRHVYLYGKSESVRTVVYCAGTTVEDSIVCALKRKFTEDDIGFGQGLFTYGFFNNNCSTLIASALNAQKLVAPSPLNSIPVCFFKRFVLDRKRASGVTVEKITLYDREAFTLHRFCVGMWGNPQKKMDRWIITEAAESLLGEGEASY
jgi:hypothetical protein